MSPQASLLVLPSRRSFHSFERTSRAYSTIWALSFESTTGGRAVPTRASSASAIASERMPTCALRYCWKRMTSAIVSPKSAWTTEQRGYLNTLESGCDDLRELVRGSLDIVVDDDVVELICLFALLPGQREPLVDLPRALRSPLPQPALELVERRRVHEDRHCARHGVPDGERALDLEVEERDLPGLVDAIDLEAERPVAMAGDVRNPFEEVASSNAAFELRIRDEPVFAPVLLAFPSLPGRRRDGELELGHTLEQSGLERALSGPRGPGHDDHGRRLSLQRGK